MKKTPAKKSVFKKPSKAIDGEDYTLLRAIERGAVKPKRVPAYRTHAKALVHAAHVRAKKDERLSFRISRQDLLELKRMAANEGLPYQTFLSSVIHKLTTGQITLRG